MKTVNRLISSLQKVFAPFLLFLLFVFPTYTLAGDPTLVWNTFMGSSMDDRCYGIKTDGSGNIYAVGHSYATWGSPLNPFAGNNDAFVAKLDSSGTLQWNTFIGSAVSGGRGIALDDSGNVYVVGDGSATWGTPVNPHTGATDVFIAKLDGNGTLQWNTFLGNADVDYGYGVAVDSSGNVYAAGYSVASWGTPVNAHTGTGSYDVFTAMLNSSGVLQWNTFMGSADDDYAYGIAVDGSGNAYVVGESPATWGTPVNPHAGGDDAFVAMFNSSGVLQWNRFMGSADTDSGWGIAVDDSGSAYVVGYSTATWGTPVNAHAGSYDGFTAKLNSSGALQWNTFMGSTGSDGAYAVVLDSLDNIYVSGAGNATWGTPVIAHTGGDDAFAVKLNSSGVLQWNTFMGSASDEISYGIAVDGFGNAYVSGEGLASWGTPLNPYAGTGSDNDAFVVRLSDTPENTIWTYNVGVPHHRLVLPDINADGYDELLLYEDLEQIRVISGADGSTQLWSYQLSVDPGRYRRGLAVINDLDGDGIKDIIAIAGTSGNDYDQNYGDDDVFALSGAITPPGNRLLWFGGEPLNIGYGANGPVVLSDTNADTFDDIFITTSTPVISPLRGDYGYLISGGDGNILWNFTYNPVSIPLITESTIWDIYGKVASPDLDGDGIDDIIVSGAGGFYGIEAWKGGGVSAANIWRSRPGEWIREPAVVGDLTGDGVPEIAAAKFNDADLKLYVLNGNTGVEVWNFAFGNTATTIQNLGDVNNSGFEDIITGSAFISGFGGSDYQVYALEGDPDAVDRVIWSYDVGQNSYVKTIDDINGDGLMDVVVTGGHNQVLILSGVDGSILLENSFSGATGGAQLGSFDDSAGDDILTSTDTMVYALTATTVTNTPPAAPPVISPADETSFNETDDIVLDGGTYSDPENHAHDLTYFQVRRADSGELVLDETLSGGVTDYTIPSGMLSPGLKYYWQVGYVDLLGAEAWSREYTFKVGTPEAESLPEVTAGQDVGDFGMISIVHWPDDPNPQAVFNIDYDPANYRIGTYDALTGGYVEFGEGLQMAPGRSYWILAREGLVVNFNGIPVSLIHDMEVCLHVNESAGNGWNMIAPPNDANYLWGDVQVGRWVEGSPGLTVAPISLSDTDLVVDTLIDRRIWLWEGGSYVSYLPADDLELESCGGYWVNAKLDGVYLVFPESAQVAGLSTPGNTMLAMKGKVLNWIKGLLPNTGNAMADNDSPPMPPAALDDNTVDPVFNGCYIETVINFDSF